MSNGTDMTTARAAEEKQELENKIIGLMHEFNTATGMFITDIDVKKCGWTNFKGDIDAVEYSLKISTEI